MLYTIPDYYKEFHCIADRCEDTCCAGWQIVIDEVSLEKYKWMTGDYRKTVWKNINWLTGTFKQDKEKRCAFLNEDNLCDLCLNKGEKSFCKTCKTYPRHIEEFEGVREISLSVSCPEAARILLNKKDKVTYLTYERAGEEEYEDFDPFFFSLLEDARSKMLNILQDRSLPIGTRVILVLGMAHDMQGRVNRQELFDCLDVIDKYITPKAIAYAKNYYLEHAKADSKYTLTRELYDKLYELELLRKDWDDLLLESDALLFAKGKNKYSAMHTAFWKNVGFAEEITIQLEQLMVYFLFTYLPGAVYDGNIYSKVQMCLYLVWMIYELWVARYVKNGGTLSIEERVDLTYRFSREVEHSDKNREHIEAIMEKKWFLA